MEAQAWKLVILVAPHARTKTIPGWIRRREASLSASTTPAASRLLESLDP